MTMFVFGVLCGIGGGGLAFLIWTAAATLSDTCEREARRGGR